MRILDTLYSTFFNKCPRCHKGDVFTEKNPYALTKLFSMHEHCSHCDLKYEKEPSFFYGAMYVSYALTSGWFIVWYILFLTVLSDLNTLTFALSMTGTIILMSPLTVRFSRLIWLNFFFKFDKELSTDKHLHQPLTVNHKP
jgi:uncharacterized protein (DUF983 family)